MAEITSLQLGDRVTLPNGKGLGTVVSLGGCDYDKCKDHLTCVGVLPDKGTLSLQFQASEISSEIA